MAAVDSLSFRSLQTSELELPLEWAASEGWNPGFHDMAAFDAADRGAFLAGELPSGEVVAVLSAVRTGDSFGFLGFYITAPEHRGLGYGMSLWEKAIARLSGRTIGLDGVVAQQDNYRKSGFVLAHRNVRYGGFPRLVREPDRGHAVEIVAANAVGLLELLAFDALHFGCPRPEFLWAWIALPESQARVLVRGGEICGFGMIRRCRTGFKIGPLFAADVIGAEALLFELAGFARGEMLFLDAPEPNRAAMGLACQYGLSPIFETARMYRGTPPLLPLDQIYGITSFELG